MHRSRPPNRETVPLFPLRPLAVDAWLDMVQDYYDLHELDRPTLMRLIQKIEISEKYTVDDHEERDIHIQTTLF